MKTLLKKTGFVRLPDQVTDKLDYVELCDKGTKAGSFMQNYQYLDYHDVYKNDNLWKIMILNILKLIEYIKMFHHLELKNLTMSIS